MLYPEIREPFRGIFTTIASGVGESVSGNVLVRSIRNDDSTEEVREWLSDNAIDVVVALGSRGHMLADEISISVPVVIGGVHMTPELIETGSYGISLNPDPGIMLQRLRSIAPDVRKVTIIYHRERDLWMVERAILVASDLGITINPIPVDSLQDAANQYRKVLRSQRSNTEALWLSQDSSVLDEQALLPMILKEAWDRKLIVFSSNPAHVRRGVLFALFPDNQAMGRSLGNMAASLHASRDVRDNGQPGGLQALSDLQTAFNIRTAGRLGIRYTRDSLNEYDLIFPPR